MLYTCTCRIRAIRHTGSRADDGGHEFKFRSQGRFHDLSRKTISNQFEFYYTFLDFQV